MTPEPQATRQPTPALLFDTINAHQRTEAIKTAIELDVFTAIARGKTSSAEIAESCGGSQRGTRIFCDYLVIIGFFPKKKEKDKMKTDSATFLGKASPAVMGSVVC